MIILVRAHRGVRAGDVRAAVDVRVVTDVHVVTDGGALRLF